MLTPDRGSRLSDGVVIETTLRGRLFGAPVLRIDATVLVSPARLVEDPAARAVRGDVVAGGRVAPRTTVTSGDARTPGDALAQATRLLEESRRRLRP